MIRVLVADDSPTARRLLVEILRGDTDFQVVGEVGDGVEAVEAARRLRPGLVIMDVHMPRMDGFAATKEIMIAAPTPIVIVTGSMQISEVEPAMHALRAGALTVLAKPPGPGSPDFDEAARQFLATAKAMSQVRVIRHWRPRSIQSRPSASGAPRHPVVAIATSTGGPAALQRVLAKLPTDFPAPILVVQHITTGFAPGLVNWLNTVCDLRVKVAEQGEALAPQGVYLAPDDRHLGVSDSRTAILSGAPPIGGFRPSATFLFESLARAVGDSAIAVILTGMGEDGVEGLRSVRQAGGRVIAQDEQTSVVYGMPGKAVAAGLADSVLPIDAISPHLEEWVAEMPPFKEGRKDNPLPGQD